MSNLLHAISESLQNQFLSGGLVLMLTASLIALCRKVPSHLWQFLLRRFTIVVDVSNDDPLFAWISLWLAEHPYSRKARSLTATSERDDYGRVLSVSTEESGDLPQVLLTPAPGNHLLWYQRRIVWLKRERKDAPPEKEGSAFMWKREVFTARLIGRSQNAARQLLEDARGAAMQRRTRKVEIFFAGYDYWQRIDERDPRPLSTVFLPDGVIDGITSRLTKFFSSQERYIERGIPWRLSFLFHGVPRSGKTSLICALAGHFRMNLYILNLGNPYLSDNNLLSLLAKVPSRSFVLLEDIDAAFNQRNKSGDAQNKLTFSGLLNALDGAGSRDGVLVFMTTNHLERLDPALTGRADVWQEFSDATADQANRMFLAFFPEAQSADGFGDQVVKNGWSMLDVQNHLIQHDGSPVKALNAVVRKERAA